MDGVASGFWGSQAAPDVPRNHGRAVVTAVDDGVIGRRLPTPQAPVAEAAGLLQQGSDLAAERRSRRRRGPRVRRTTQLADEKHQLLDLVAGEDFAPADHSRRRVSQVDRVEDLLI